MDKWTEWDIQLMEAVLEEHPVQEQLDIAALMLSNPVALFDASFSLICYSGSVSSTTHDPIWNTVLTYGYSSTQNFSPEFLRYFREETDIHKILLYPDFSVPSHNRILACRLVGSDGPFAFLAMDEINTPFVPEDQEVLLNIQNRLQYSRKIREAAGFVDSGSTSVLVRLLKGDHVSSEQLRKLASEHYWKDSDFFETMVIGFPGPAGSVHEAAYSSIIRRLKFADNSFQYCLVDGNIVGVHHNKSPLFPEPHSSNSILHILESLDLNAGVSMKHRGYTYLRQEYEQGLYASRLAKAQKARIVQYSDYPITSIKQALVQENHSLSSYCHPAVLLLASGPTANPMLLDTLYYYLDSGHHAARAAQKLGVHRNTVLYRLRSIEAITGLSLESPDDLPEEELEFLKISCILMRQSPRPTDE